MTSSVLRIVASAIRLQRELDTARAWAAFYAEQHERYRREAYIWCARVAETARELDDVEGSLEAARSELANVKAELATLRERHVRLRAELIAHVHRRRLDELGVEEES